jgi:hypothetical protein
LILFGDGADTQHSPVQKIVFNHLTYRDISLARISISGKKVGDFPIVVTREDGPHLPAPPRRKPGHRNFMALMVDEPSLPRAREGFSSRRLPPAQYVDIASRAVLQELGLFDTEAIADNGHDVYQGLIDDDGRNAIQSVLEALAFGDKDPEEDSNCDGAEAGRTGPAADRAVVPLAQRYGPPEQLAEPAGSTADLAAPAPLAPGPWDHLGLEERAGNTFYDLSQGTYIGRVHTVGAGGVKALCHRHPHCICWLNSNVLQATAIDDLVVWLSLAVTEDEQGHYTASQRLKRKHGMRV